MANKKKFDFSGWVTKFNILCSDGRTIKKGAFNDCDGKTVPLLWHHDHDDPENVIGNILLECREEGVYGYGSFNSSKKASTVKPLVEHGDLTSMSIYANKLEQRNGDVYHGMIREVSIVLSGANEGAYIDHPILAHSGAEVEEDAIIWFKENEIDCLSHEDDNEDDDDDEEIAHEDKSVKDILATFNEAQKECLAKIIAIELSEEEGDEEVKHEDEDEEDEEDSESDDSIEAVYNSMTDDQQFAVAYVVNHLDEIRDLLHEEEEEEDDEEDEEDDEEFIQNEDEEGEDFMKKNVFESGSTEQKNFLSHEDFMSIVEDARKSGSGSLKQAFEDFANENSLSHDGILDADGNTVTYGIANIGYMFPDAQLVNNEPSYMKRDTEWVEDVLNGCHHSPMSRLKTLHADITNAEARAKGYITGTQKAHEVFSLLKRVTSPQTIYKLQKLDRDDIIDIKDINVVAWLKNEMRMMLREECARAVLVGDGRLANDPYKINEANVRPIWTDDELYTVHKAIPDVDSTNTPMEIANAVIDAAVAARTDYRGRGTPTFYCAPSTLTSMLLLKDGIGNRLYKTIAELADAMRVSKIVEVPIMECLIRNDSATDTDYALAGIIVNLQDYTIGADKGGELNMFDDFDINFNQYEYLLETRMSGSLLVPKSAVVLEYETLDETAEDDDE